MEAILKLLDELEELLDQSRAIPFSNKVSVDKDQVYGVLAEVRMKLPNEIKQAKWVIEQRNKILVDAQKEAEEIAKTAEERMLKMVDENEVTRRAYDQAANIIETSKKTSKEMRLGANEYADEVLSIAESRVKSLIATLQDENEKTISFLQDTLDTIFQNRQELKGGTLKNADSE